MEKNNDILKKALYRRSISPESSTLKNVYYPNIFFNTTEFTLNPQENILILLEDEHNLVPQHSCNTTSWCSNQLGLEVTNHHKTNAISVQIHAPLSQLIYLNDVSSRSIYIKPCLPRDADENKYYKINPKNPPFYLDLPRLKLNSYSNFFYELEDDEGTYFPIKHVRLISGARHSYDPNNTSFLTPRIVLPKDYFIYDISHKLSMYDCKTDLVTTLPQEHLSLIIINNSQKENVICQDSNTLLTYLYHPDVIHQLVRIQIQPKTHYPCFIM